MGKIVKVDGTIEYVEGMGAGKSLTLFQIKQAIGGGHIEAVECNPTVTEGYNHFYCDEEGKLKGLEPNWVATALSTYTAKSDVICGDVIFCRSDGEGNSY